jgi:hypothetical protein
MKREDINVEEWFGRILNHIKDFKDGKLDNIRQAENSNPFYECLCQLFIHNATLWGYEDEVRRTDITDTEIVKYKRLIDRENQLRNDHIDKADSVLRDLLSGAGLNKDDSLPLNTETPGSVFDRLTITALRVYHLGLEIDRDDATGGHKEKCSKKKAEVLDRAGDLITSLEELLDDIFSGKKRLKSYGTHKLYNDPETNPAVRAALKK